MGLMVLFYFCFGNYSFLNGSCWPCSVWHSDLIFLVNFSWLHLLTFFNTIAHWRMLNSLQTLCLYLYIFFEVLTFLNNIVSKVCNLCWLLIIGTMFLAPLFNVDHPILLISVPEAHVLCDKVSSLLKGLAQMTWLLLGLWFDITPFLPTPPFLWGKIL